MQPSVETAPTSRKRLWAGRVISALPVLMLLLSGVMKLLKPVPVVEGFGIQKVRLSSSEFSRSPALSSTSFRRLPILARF